MKTAVFLVGKQRAWSSSVWKPGGSFSKWTDVEDDRDIEVCVVLPTAHTHTHTNSLTLTHTEDRRAKQPGCQIHQPFEECFLSNNVQFVCAA